jgi:hypothetical protein
VLAGLPLEGVAGAGASGEREGGVSVHLAFICLLHLANEHGLALKNSEGRLDSLDILLGGGGAHAARQEH